MRRVVQTTWNWQAATAETQSESLSGLRRAAIIQGLITAGIGAVLVFGLGHVLFGRVLWALAAFVLFLGLAAPRAYKPIHGFGQRLGQGVGKILLYVLMVPFYYLFFLPVALWLRLRGRDPLHRKYRAPDITYWIARAPKDRQANIRDQFLREDRSALADHRPVDRGERSS